MNICSHIDNVETNRQFGTSFETIFATFEELVREREVNEFRMSAVVWREDVMCKQGAENGTLV